MSDNNCQINTLQDLSGLTVLTRKERGYNVYEFFNLGRSVKTTFSYPKARAFAEGVRFGRMLTLKDQQP
jgi:hypothetical protein